jgi:Flp pilus assembly protein TadD
MVLLRCLLLFSLALTVSGAPQRTSANIDTLLSDAGALVQAGRLAEAETATRKILTTHPRNAEAHSLLGVILDQRGATADADK